MPMAAFGEFVAGGKENAVAVDEKIDDAAAITEARDIEDADAPVVAVAVARRAIRREAGKRGEVHIVR